MRQCFVLHHACFLSGFYSFVLLVEIVQQASPLSILLYGIHFFCYESIHLKIINAHWWRVQSSSLAAFVPYVCRKVDHNWLAHVLSNEHRAITRRQVGLKKCLHQLHSRSEYPSWWATRQIMAVSSHFTTMILCSYIVGNFQVSALIGKQEGYPPPSTLAAQISSTNAPRVLYVSQMTLNVSFHRVLNFVPPVRQRNNSDALRIVSMFVNFISSKHLDSQNVPASILVCSFFRSTSRLKCI